MPRTGTTSRVSTSRAWELFVLLRREPGGPVMAVERVAHRDMRDARSEFWFEALARRGATEVPVRGVEVELLPCFERTGAGPDPERVICAGFSLLGTGADGRPVRCDFDRASLPTHARAAERLERSLLGPGGTYFYELRAEPAQQAGGAGRATATPGVSGASGAGRPTLVVTEQHEPERFAVCRTPLAPLLAAAEPGPGPTHESWTPGAEQDYPVFYTRAARTRAEQVARCGARFDPAVETGGLLVGPLCSCPDTGELFAVVVDVFEAEHAESSTHSLTFSARTWSGFQSRLAELQADPATRHHRFLGQVHGHSFLPFEGAAPCADCTALEVCTRSSAYLSEADLSFCKTLFPAQPWQLSHVFGLDARGRGVEAFYGQRRGELAPRGYRLIEHFEPAPACAADPCPPRP